MSENSTFKGSHKALTFEDEEADAAELVEASVAEVCTQHPSMDALKMTTIIETPSNQVMDGRFEVLGLGAYQRTCHHQLPFMFGDFCMLLSPDAQLHDHALMQSSSQLLCRVSACCNMVLRVPRQQVGLAALAKVHTATANARATCGI